MGDMLEGFSDQEVKTLFEMLAKAEGGKETVQLLTQTSETAKKFANQNVRDEL